MPRPALTNASDDAAGSRRRAAVAFATAGAVAAVTAAVPGILFLGPAPWLPVVGLATGSAAAAGALFHRPLARARAGRRIGKAVLLGIAVAGAAYALFSVAFSLVLGDASGFWGTLSFMVGGVGLTFSPGLAAVGGVAGALYVQ